MSSSPPARATAEPAVAAETANFPVWALPEVILYHIVGFVAPPTHRANVLCNQIAILCKDAQKEILQDERSVALWGAVLVGDYGIGGDNSNKSNTGKRCNALSSDSPKKSASRKRKQQQPPQRRSCQRLRRSPCHQVRDAHKLMKDNTEIAFFYLSELAHTAGGGNNGKGGLTRRDLVGILNEYGPFLRFNNPVSSGGTYLVEVCRARRVRENVILKCVEELVDQRGCLLDLQTAEAKNSQLTALCVAAVRGMPSVVRYLLKKGASKDISCSGRFRLATNARKSVRCTDSTPLGFALTMRQSELDEGAATGDLSNLDKCINLLK